MPYCTRDDIEKVYGAKNVARWADIDNDMLDDKITARIDYFIAETDNDIDDTLRDGPYTVPFTVIHSTITSISARLTGFKLYESRGITDAEPNNNQLSGHLDYAERQLQAILSGKIRLDEDRVASIPDVYEG